MQEKYAARKYLSVRPAHHNRTRQKEKRHRGRFPIEISRCAPIFIHLTGGFPPLVQSLRLPHEQKYPQPPWVQRTQELPSLICSSAGSAVATLHFGFCSAAVRSASRVKKSKIKVRGRNDIHLARRHQGSPTSPDVHVCAMCIVCDLARPRSVLTLSWSNRETLAGLWQTKMVITCVVARGGK